MRLLWSDRQVENLVDLYLYFIEEVFVCSVGIFLAEFYHHLGSCDRHVTVM